MCIFNPREKGGPESGITGCGAASGALVSSVCPRTVDDNPT